MAETAAAMVLAEDLGCPAPVPKGEPPAVGPEVGGVETDVTGPVDLVATTLMANFWPS